MRALVVAATLLLGFLAGGLVEHFYPVHFGYGREYIAGGTVITDSVGRLMAYPGKVELPCPRQTSHTAVLLLLGQSNAANHQGQRYIAQSDSIVNYYHGRCYRASSPLLGAEGEYGESWTLLANKLISNKLFDRVILVPAGVGGTSITRWTPRGDLGKGLIALVDEVQSRYRITHVLWHQGEADFSDQMSETRYETAFRQIMAALRARNLTAPIYVSQASFAVTDRHWQADNPITRAQKAVTDGKSVLAGPNTDAEIGIRDRFDGTHFSASGQEKFTDEWLQILSHGPR